MRSHNSVSPTILRHLLSGCNTLVTILFVIHIRPYEAFQSNLPQPYQITFSLPESGQVRHDPIDLVQLLRTQLDLHVKSEPTDKLPTNSRALFEILDVSSNLLTSFQHRGQVSFLNLIDLHPMLGTLRFNVPLDRERVCPDLQNSDLPCKISILLAAYQLKNTSNLESDGLYAGSSVPTSSDEMIYVELIIIVLDVNDNAPYFAQHSTTDIHVRTLQIQEECPVGTMISLPMASDLDSAKHGIVKYEFHAASTTPDVLEHFEIVPVRGTRIQCEDLNMHEFVLDKQHVLTKPDALLTPSPLVPCLRVISRIDRERIGRFSFRLVATDSGGKQGETVIRIQVRDINDHAPTWPDKLDVSLSPDSPVFVHFERIIHRPTDSSDQTGPNKTNQLVKYTYKVMECTRQRQLLHLTTSDLDSTDSENGRVTYQMSDQTPDVDQIRQRLFVSSDYVYLTDLGLKGLSEANLTLIVTASDAAGKSSDAWILLMVQDCNDHKPMILMRTSEFSIPENMIGSSQLISLITVRDLDLITSPNSQFTCSINDTNHLRLEEVMSGPKSVDFNRKSMDDMDSLSESTLDSGEGRSVLSRQGRWSIYRLETLPSTSFDRELASVHYILLQCSDQGVPPLTSNMILSINVLDRNDNAPVFIVDEFNRPLNQNHFSLTKHGMLTRKNLYSYTNSMSYATTRNQTALYKFTVPENAQRGTMIGSVRAIDWDSGDNGRIVYEIVNVSAKHTQLTDVQMDKHNQSDPMALLASNEMFALAANGDIQLINELDREQIDQYEILIRATDSAKTERLSSTAKVLINVEDVNDCRPQFEGDYVFEVVESYGSSTIHQMLGIVKAFDMDLGRNGSVTYRLGTNTENSAISERGSHPNPSYHLPGSHLVQISHDGKLSVYGVVDREKTPLIMVTVVAEDNGQPVRLSSSITITIHVLDLNDNKPRFVESSSLDSNGQIRLNQEGSPNDPADFADKSSLPLLSGLKLNLSLDTNVGTLLTVFLAHDPDNGPNGTLVYDLVYSGLPTSSPEKKQNPYSKPDPSDSDDNNQLPTFTLHPDGRLLLSKRLTYTDLIPNPLTQTSKRYRRPDRLLVRVSDKGPQPEQSIITLQIFYYDPVDLMKSRNPSNVPPDLSSAHHPSKLSGNDHLPSSNILTDLDSKSGYSQGQRLKSVPNALLPPPRSTDRQAARHVGLPIIYMLALAVCFALILVILSFICLYLKMRKNPSRASLAKHYDDLVKLDTNNESLLNCQNNESTHVRNKHVSSPTMVKALEDVRSATLCCPGPNSIATVDYSMGSEHYRTLSPPYFVQNHMVPNAMLIKEPMSDASMSGSRWTTLGPDYRTLPLSNIHEILLSPNPSHNCSIQDEFVLGNPKTHPTEHRSDQIPRKCPPNCPRRSPFDDSRIYNSNLKIHGGVGLDTDSGRSNKSNGTALSKGLTDSNSCRQDSGFGKIIENLRLTKTKPNISSSSGPNESTQLDVISSSSPCSSLTASNSSTTRSAACCSAVIHTTTSSVSFAIAPSGRPTKPDVMSTFKPESFKPSLWIENPNQADETLLDLDNKTMNQLSHVTGSFV